MTCLMGPSAVVKGLVSGIHQTDRPIREGFSSWIFISRLTVDVGHFSHSVHYGMSLTTDLWGTLRRTRPDGAGVGIGIGIDIDTTRRAVLAFAVELSSILHYIIDYQVHVHIVEDGEMTLSFAIQPLDFRAS